MELRDVDPVDRFEVFDRVGSAARPEDDDVGAGPARDGVAAARDDQVDPFPAIDLVGVIAAIDDVAAGAAFRLSAPSEAAISFGGLPVLMTSARERIQDS
jgi:hypothetical protein